MPARDTIQNVRLMDPIDVRAETTFAHALRCVQYRLPNPQGLRAPGYVLALGIRYGFIGMAASHHLLITAECGEEPYLLAIIEEWPDLVEDHVHWEVSHRIALTTSPNISHLIGRVAALPLQAYLPLYQRMCPLKRALEIVGEAVVADNKAMIYEGWPWFKRKAALRAFEANLRESADYAINFFERRQADLDEVPEIALIGE